MNEIDVVRAFIAAINRRSVAELSDFMTEDHTFIDSTGRTESGRKEIAAGWEAFFCLFPDYTIQIETILGQGELVAVFGSASGTFNGQRGLVPENWIGMPAAWRVVVRHGKVKRWQVYADWTEGNRRMAEDGAAGQLIEPRRT